MNHMCNSAHRGAHKFSVRNISVYDVDPVTRFKTAVVAERAYRNIRAVIGAQNARDE